MQDRETRKWYEIHRRLRAAFSDNSQGYERKLTLSHELPFELVEEFQSEFILCGQGFFTNYSFHGRSISPNGVFGILLMNEIFTTEQISTEME